MKKNFIIGGTALAIGLICVASWFSFPKPYQHEDLAQAGIWQLESHIHAYIRYYGKAPSSLEGLLVAPPGEGERKAPFAEAGELSDIWGKPYRYVLKESNGFEIRSAGSDETFDTKDDIKNIWEKP